MSKTRVPPDNVLRPTVLRAATDGERRINGSSLRATGLRGQIGGKRRQTILPRCPTGKGGRKRMM